MRWRDYLETYAERFDLGADRDTCRRSPGRGIGTSSRPRVVGSRRTASSSRPGRIGSRTARRSLAARPAIRQLHSSEYRRPSQLQEGGRPARRRGELGGRHLVRASRTHRHLAGRQGVGADPGPHRDDPGANRVQGLPLLRPSRAHAADAYRPASHPKVGGKADPLIRVKPKELSRCGRRAGRAGGRGPGRPSDPRGRPGARRGERDLVHRVPHRLPVDRSAGLRGGRRADARPGRGVRPSRVCTSSGCTASTRSRRTCSQEPAGTTPTWHEADRVARVTDARRHAGHRRRVSRVARDRTDRWCRPCSTYPRESHHGPAVRDPRG